MKKIIVAVLFIAAIALASFVVIRAQRLPVDDAAVAVIGDKCPSFEVQMLDGEEFVFLPISRGEKPEVVSAWRTKKGYKFDTGLDIATEIFPLFARTYIPRNYLIDPDGTIVYYEVGYDAKLFDELVNKIDETIQNAKK